LIFPDFAFAKFGLESGIIAVMKKTNSTIWLIIFLCFVLLGIAFIWGYDKYTSKTSVLINENANLKKQMFILEEKNKSLMQKPVFVSSPSASVKGK